jgi:hypothetical protein
MLLNLQCSEQLLLIKEQFNIVFKCNNTVETCIQKSSSSSSALQPGVGFGLPFEGFITMIVLQGGVVNPMPNPHPFWRTNVFCQGCLHIQNITKLILLKQWNLYFRRSSFIKCNKSNIS